MTILKCFWSVLNCVPYCPCFYLKITLSLKIREKKSKNGQKKAKHFKIYRLLQCIWIVYTTSELVCGGENKVSKHPVYYVIFIIDSLTFISSSYFPQNQYPDHQHLRHKPTNRHHRRLSHHRRQPGQISHVQQVLHHKRPSPACHEDSSRQRRLLHHTPRTGRLLSAVDSIFRAGSSLPHQ